MASDYDSGRSRASNHGLPTTGESCSGDFMRGFRDATPAPMPVFTQPVITYPKPPDHQAVSLGASTEPSAPFTLASAIRPWTVLGVVACVAYAFLTQRIDILQAGIAGLVGGAVVGAGFYVAVLIIRGVVWLLGWVIKLGLILATTWVVMHYFLHAI